VHRLQRGRDMSRARALSYVETEGGPFILLPLEARRHWRGVGDDPDDPASDYARAAKVGTSVGTLPVGPRQALVLGNPEVTAFWPLAGGGIFVQRIMGDEDAEVAEAVEDALRAGPWRTLGTTFEVGKGKLALFDSAYAYADADEDERLTIALAPGRYALSRCDVKNERLDLELIRLERRET
jgi:hypothetical protein